MTHEKICFVISPIGEAESETRKRADQVLKHVIRPAVLSCGYKAVRADEIDKPGMITSQVIQHVVADPLVVADLTERNPNVFYELAIRHALRKPLVQIIKKGETIPFDVAGTRTIYVDHKDLDSVEAARNEIIEQIKALEKDSSALETPISVSLDLQILRQSDKPEDRSLADLVAAVSELRGGLQKLESGLGAKEQQAALGEIQNQVRMLSMRLEEGDFPRSMFWRRGRGSPRMLMEMVEMGHMAGGGRMPELGILVIASMFRDSMPWLYELGVDTFRRVRAGKREDASKAIEEFRNVVQYSTHGPWVREFTRGKEGFMMMEEIDMMMDHLLRHHDGKADGDEEPTAAARSHKKRPDPASGT